MWRLLKRVVLPDDPAGDPLDIPLPGEPPPEEATQDATGSQAA